MNTDEAKRKALADLADRDEGEPALAWHAIAVLDALGFDDDTVMGEAGREKLAGRPCGKVREFASYAKTKRPEQRQNLLTMFARKVGPA